MSFNSLLVSIVSGDKSAVTVLMLPCMWGVIFLLRLSRFSLFLWLATVWLCIGIELSVFMLLGLLSFLDELLLKYILAIISSNSFFVCCPNHDCNLGLIEPLSLLTCLSPRLSLQSVRPWAGLLPSTLNWVSPFSPLQRSCWSSWPTPAKQNLATNRARKGHGEESQAKSHRFLLFSPKFSSYLSTNTSQIFVCLWCISRGLKQLIFWGQFCLAS